MKTVKFIGKFRDLKPDGWTFQKLFARNYRQYHKTCDGQEYSQGCRIWQHHGGYLEIDTLGDLSYIIVQKIIDGTIKECEYKVRAVFTGLDKYVYWFIIDRETNQLYHANSQEYKDIRREYYRFLKMEETPEVLEKLNIHCDRYSDWNMRPELLVMIEDLVKKGWITV